MGRTAVESCFEVAFWLLDRATNDSEYLQPQKMHRMMFLSHAYYGVLQRSAKLMPATFIAVAEGPIEPTIFRAFSRGRPNVEVASINEVSHHVLDSVWRQFGAQSVDHLNKLIRAHSPYADAFAAGPGTEIPFEAMVEFYGSGDLSQRQSKTEATQLSAPAASRVARPKVMRNHAGKPVSVNSWAPKRVD